MWCLPITDMNGMNNHFVAIELDEELLAKMEQNAEVTATFIIPYSTTPNRKVSRIISDFGIRAQVLEMNMAMAVNRMATAQRYVNIKGGEIWKSLPSKLVPNQNTQGTSSNRGDASRLLETFWDME